MIKPKVKLVDYNSKKPNLQDKKFDDNGVSVGRIVVQVKEVNTYDSESHETWGWKVSYENFQLSSNDEHNETWDFGTDPPTHLIDDSRKLGGKFLNGYDSAKFLFELTRTYVKSNEIQVFTWFFAWTQAGKFVEIVEGEDPIEEPIDCEEFKLIIKNMSATQTNLTKEVEKLKDEIEKLKNIGKWKFFTAFNPKNWDWKGLLNRTYVYGIVAIVSFVFGIIL